jgi:hypothetical protein
MKIVKNTSMQGLTVPFKTPTGITSIFLAPKAKVDVPDTWTSKVLVNLVQRRMIKLTTVMDAPAVVAVDKKVAKPRVVKESKRNNS